MLLQHEERRRRENEEASVTRPLQVFAVMDAANIIVTCVNMAGDELARFTLNPDAKFHALLALVREHLPLQDRCWTLISPNGETLNESQSDLPVDFLFGLPCDG